MSEKTTPGKPVAWLVTRGSDGAQYVFIRERDAFGWLDPDHETMTALVAPADYEAVVVERNVMREALKRIEKWFGEFPESERTWPDGSPMSYIAAFGSNGERDYMRAVARDALGK